MDARRAPNDNEKEELLRIHGRKCYVDGEPIPDGGVIHFHHIKPWSDDGPTVMDNIAPVCKSHNLSMGTMSIEEYRDRITLRNFFEGEPKYLNEVIIKKNGICGQQVTYELGTDSVKLYFMDAPRTYPLYECPAKHWKYFYATIPIQYIENDKELQPRPLREESVWNLYKHFLRNTQLSPSICRIEEDRKLLLFDGQHKAAAQIWAGRKQIECKVYVLPDQTVLKETNLEAHGPFRQMSFYSHELRQKYADICGEDWEEYMETEGEKSEYGFFNYLVHGKNKTKTVAINEIASAIYHQVVNDPENKLKEYTSTKHRGRKLPLTPARVEKAFLKQWLMPPPVKDEFESESDYRNEEKGNFIRLINIVTEEGLESRWAPERKDAGHQKAERIFGAGAVRAWALLLRDSINAYLRHFTDEERSRFLYCHVPDEAFEYFRKFARRLFSHKLWNEPDESGEINARLAKDDATTAKTLFEEQGLTVDWILRVPE